MAVFQIVQHTEETGIVCLTYASEAELLQGGEFEVTGHHASDRTREELQGQPKLAGFNGPTWGGETKDFEPIIRYEDQAAYDILSM